MIFTKPDDTPVATTVFAMEAIMGQICFLDFWSAGDLKGRRQCLEPIFVGLETPALADIMALLGKQRFLRAAQAFRRNLTQINDVISDTLIIHKRSSVVFI